MQHPPSDQISTEPFPQANRQAFAKRKSQKLKKLF